MIQWVACDPSTGRVIESLPGIRLESSLPCYVGKGDNVSLSLPVAQRPDRWLIATEPDRVVLVAHHDDAAQTILWAGLCIFRSYGSGPAISLTAQALDGWLATQYTGTVIGAPYSVVNRDHALIMADMLAPLVAEFHGRIDVTLTGQTMSHFVKDSDDKTCADEATYLMGLGQVEYRIGWEWDSTNRLVCVATVGPHIGSTTPSVVLSDVTWSKSNDYSNGRGATRVTATATTSGSVRNQASAVAADLEAAGYVPVEVRTNPDNGATSSALLGQWSQARLGLLRGGTVGVEISFHPDSDVVLGRDFQVGDVISADLENPDMPEVAQTVTGRMVGWTADPDRVSGEIVKITPVLEAS